jgi:hypothetical protein
VYQCGSRKPAGGGDDEIDVEFGGGDDEMP